MPSIVRHLGRVERRQRLIERCGITKHVTHIRHLGRVERRQRLIERAGILKTWHACSSPGTRRTAAAD